MIRILLISRTAPFSVQFFEGRTLFSANLFTWIFEHFFSIPINYLVYIPNCASYALKLIMGAQQSMPTHAADLDEGQWAEVLYVDDSERERRQNIYRSLTGRHQTY
jgi:hypothetical protein